ncbi:MAG: cupin domain-containing protein [Pseudomonadota bacterium]
MAQYHPSEDLLAMYASGSADAQTEALIAAHLTYCPICRRIVAEHEKIAGALFENSAGPGAINPAGVEDILKIKPQQAPAVIRDAPAGSLNNIAPRPLVNYLHQKTGVTDIDALNWTNYAPGIKRAIIVGNQDAALVRLIKAEPGAKFPEHGHGSDELALVLTGAYHDQTGRYATGDVQTAPAALSHQPIVENDGVCFAFVVSEKPAIPKNIAAKTIERTVGK